MAALNMANELSKLQGPGAARQCRHGRARQEHARARRAGAAARPAARTVGKPLITSHRADYRRAIRPVYSVPASPAVFDKRIGLPRTLIETPRGLGLRSALCMSASSGKPYLPATCPTCCSGSRATIRTGTGGWRPFLISRAVSLSSPRNRDAERCCPAQAVAIAAARDPRHAGGRAPHGRSRDADRAHPLAEARTPHRAVPFHA